MLLHKNELGVSLNGYDSLIKCAEELLTASNTILYALLVMRGASQRRHVPMIAYLRYHVTSSPPRLPNPQ